MLLVFSAVIIIILTICDQLLKHWIVSTIALGASRTVIPQTLALTNLRNDGAAWSMLEGRQGFFALITVIAIMVISYFIWRYRKNGAMLVGLSLVMAGTLGNFIDRLSQGYVVDMFETLFINFPIFNIADVCLTVGVVWLIICILREKDEDDRSN